MADLKRDIWRCIDGTWGAETERNGTGAGVKGVSLWRAIWHVLTVRRPDEHSTILRGGARESDGLAPRVVEPAAGSGGPRSRLGTAAKLEQVEAHRDELIEIVSELIRYPRHTHPGSPAVSFENKPIELLERAQLAVMAAPSLPLMTAEREATMSDAKTRAALSCMYALCVEILDDPHPLIQPVDYFRHRLGTAGHVYAVEDVKRALAERDELRAQVDRYREALDDALEQLDDIAYDSSEAHKFARRCAARIRALTGIPEPVERERP